MMTATITDQALELRSLKARKIANLHKLPRSFRATCAIEVLHAEAIVGGIQTFVRAWDLRGNPIGFGADGSIETERMRIFNPPLLIDHPQGEIIRLWINPETGGLQVRRLHEDPREALLQVIEHNIQLVGKPFAQIRKGSVGNTTSTFFPAAGSNSPVDGSCSRFLPASGEAWSTIRSGAGTGFSNTAATIPIRFSTYTTSNQFDLIERGIFGFDTSAIPDSDEISPATFSIYSHSNAVDGNYAAQTVKIDRCVPASSSTLAASDYNIANWPGIAQSDTAIACNTFDGTGYKDFPLNATGIGNISKTGLSWYGARVSADFDNSAPTWFSSVDCRASVFPADEAGTTKDPMLVVVHAAAGATPISLRPQQSNLSWR